MSLTVPKVEWLERHAGKQGLAGSIPGKGTYFLLWILRLLPVSHSTEKTIQMKSVMKFIQSNGCTEINIEKVRRQFMWRHIGFKDKERYYIFSVKEQTYMYLWIALRRGYVYQQ